MSYSKIKKVRISTWDAKWSRIVRDRDGKCLVCGKTQYLAAHHFLRRSVKPTRLMVENGVTLCPSHHTFNSDFSAHKTPEAFKEWFRSKFPQVASMVDEKAKTHMTEKQAIDEFKEKYIK